MKIKNHIIYFKNKLQKDINKTSPQWKPPRGIHPAVHIFESNCTAELRDGRSIIIDQYGIRSGQSTQKSRLEISLTGSWKRMAREEEDQSTSVHFSHTQFGLKWTEVLLKRKEIAIEEDKEKQYILTDV